MATSRDDGSVRATVEDLNEMLCGDTNIRGQQDGSLISIPRRPVACICCHQT